MQCQDRRHNQRREERRRPDRSTRVSNEGATAERNFRVKNLAFMEGFSFVILVVT